MLHDAIDALVNRDARLAHRVCAADGEVNQQKRSIRHAVEALLRVQPERVPAWLALLAAARNLERIADHAVNIAEDVIYLVEGRIMRHAGEPLAGISHEPTVTRRVSADW